MLFSFFFGAEAGAKSWTLKDCIDYALSKNIDVRKSYLSTQGNELSLEQSKANILPSLTGSVGNNLNWNKSGEKSFRSLLTGILFSPESRVASREP